MKHVALLFTVLNLVGLGANLYRGDYLFAGVSVLALAASVAWYRAA